VGRLEAIDADAVVLLERRFSGGESSVETKDDHS
jgi:hypothetical protein